MFDLTGKTVVVTGGSRGLGLEICEGMGEMGANVVLVARKADQLEAAKARLQSQGIKAFAIAADLSVEDAIPNLVDRTLGLTDGIDVLVNNAGASWAERAESHSLAGWRKVMTLNVESAFLLSQEVARRAMIPLRRGSIINIASVGGLSGNRPKQHATTLAYNTSKGALVNFTRALAMEWGAYGITVNAMCPGYFQSKMTGVLLREIEGVIVEDTPLGRLAGQGDFKGLAVLLASEAGRFISGQTIAIDGGYSAA